MNHFPKDIENIIRSFLFKCRVCNAMFEYPMYITCSKCVIEYKNVCKKCFIIIHKTSCICHKNIK